MHSSFENMTEREAAVLRVFCLHLSDKIGRHVLSINSGLFEDNIRILFLAEIRNMIKDTAEDLHRSSNDLKPTRDLGSESYDPHNI